MHLIIVRIQIEIDLLHCGVQSLNYNNDKMMIPKKLPGTHMILTTCIIVHTYSIYPYSDIYVAEDAETTNTNLEKK
jgi:hypothetical protein